MRIHIVTVGQPKLCYARDGWDEYYGRLGHFHQVRVTHLSDKYSADAQKLLDAAGSAYKVALVIDGNQMDSHQLSSFLQKRAQESREVCFIIGGPDGLPPEVAQVADYHWSLSPLTFPHDLAMVILVEALYRASTITAGHPYHH